MKRIGLERRQSELAWFFYFHFLQKYIFDLEIYRNIPRPPRYRAAGRQCLICKKKSTKNCAEVPRGPAARQQGGQPSRPPGRGAAGPGRPPAGRPAPQPYIRCWLPLTPSFGSPKIQKKKEGGRERRGEGEAKRRSPAGFSSRRL